MVLSRVGKRRVYLGTTVICGPDTLVGILTLWLEVCPIHGF